MYPWNICYPHFHFGVFLASPKYQALISYRREAVPHLVETLKDELERVRRFAAEALGKIRHANGP